MNDNLMETPASAHVPLALLATPTVVTAQNCTSTITDVACGTEGFATLCTALQVTGLDDDLSSDQWTVFAPTDDAFADLGSDNIEYLLNDTLALTDLLLFHVVPSLVTAEELPCEAGANLIEMANGDDLRSLCKNDVPTFLKGAFNPRDDATMPMLVETDIETCSGIIHIVNGVLLSMELPFDIDGSGGEDDDDIVIDDDEVIDETVAPTEATIPPTVAPVMAATSAPTTAPVAETTTPPQSDECMTISEIACSLDDFTTLCGLIGAQNLTDVLDDGLWTVFAPTDAAFEDIAIADDEQEIILDILLFHVVPDAALNSDMLVCTETTAMANMEDSRHVCEKDVDGNTVRFQKGASNPRDNMPQIVQTDIEACGGSIIHVVSQVMLPE